MQQLCVEPAQPRAYFSTDPCSAKLFLKQLLQKLPNSLDACPFWKLTTAYSSHAIDKTLGVEQETCTRTGLNVGLAASFRSGTDPRGLRATGLGREVLCKLETGLPHRGCSLTPGQRVIPFSHSGRTVGTLRQQARKEEYH